MPTDSTTAVCLSNTSETLGFNDYIKKCRTMNDKVRSANFFSESKDTIKNTFENLRAQLDDTIVTGDSINTMMNLTGSTNETVDKQINALYKKKKKLLDDIKHYRHVSDSADKTFLEDIYNGTPKKDTLMSFQDLTLLFFWFGWLLFVIVLVAVRWFSPNGTWQAGIFTLLLMLLVTITIYGLLIQVA